MKKHTINLSTQGRSDLAKDSDPSMTDKSSYVRHLPDSADRTAANRQRMRAGMTTREFYKAVEPGQSIQLSKPNIPLSS